MTEPTADIADMPAVAHRRGGGKFSSFAQFLLIDLGRHKLHHSQANTLRTERRLLNIYGARRDAAFVLSSQGEYETFMSCAIANGGRVVGANLSAEFRPDQESANCWHDAASPILAVLGRRPLCRSCLRSGAA